MGSTVVSKCRMGGHISVVSINALKEDMRSREQHKDVGIIRCPKDATKIPAQQMRGIINTGPNHISYEEKEKNQLKVE